MEFFRPRVNVIESDEGSRSKSSAGPVTGAWSIMLAAVGALAPDVSRSGCGAAGGLGRFERGVRTAKELAEIVAPDAVPAVAEDTRTGRVLANVEQALRCKT
jgi:hypothetical protein